MKYAQQEGETVLFSNVRNAMARLSLAGELTSAFSRSKESSVYRAKLKHFRNGKTAASFGPNPFGDRGCGVRHLSELSEETY